MTFSNHQEAQSISGSEANMDSWQDVTLDAIGQFPGCSTTDSCKALQLAVSTPGHGRLAKADTDFAAETKNTEVWCPESVWCPVARTTFRPPEPGTPRGKPRRERIPLHPLLAS